MMFSWRRRASRFAILPAVLAGFGTIAAAAEMGSRLIEQGRAIAEAKCGRCHATGPSGDSPHHITPPFHRLHEDFPIPMLSDAAEQGVLSGHDEMPMFEFSPDEVRALLAYIDSLATGKARYLAPGGKQ